MNLVASEESSQEMWGAQANQARRHPDTQVALDKISSYRCEISLDKGRSRRFKASSVRSYSEPTQRATSKDSQTKAG